MSIKKITDKLMLDEMPAEDPAEEKESAERKEKRKLTREGIAKSADFARRVFVALMIFIWKKISAFAVKAWEKIKEYAGIAWEKTKNGCVWLYNAIKSGNRKVIAITGAALLLLIMIPAGISAIVPGKGDARAVDAAQTAMPGETGTAGAEETTVTVTPAPTLPEITPTPEPKLQLKYGVTDPEVARVQQRLMDLSYMDPDEPTEYYGSATTDAVKLFQKKNDLEVDGAAGDMTLEKLFSDDAKEYVAVIGDKGTDIEEMQVRLYELGYISSKKQADGAFGEQTEEAVKRFQEKNKLTVDGKLGPNTKETLYSEDVVANSFTIGDESEDIKKYQKRLKKLGYLTTEPDGKFGEDTLDAIKRFQRDNGLIVDGYAGPQTQELLMSSSVSASAFKIGDSGDQVTNIQERLKELKYLKKVTGYFGSDTESAVKAFQKRNGLTADGKVGAATLDKLNSSKAKKAASNSSGGGSSSKSKSGVERLIAAAESKLGCPYVLGAKGPNKFDCSGLAYWCINQAGVKQSYMTSRAWRSCTKYKKIKSINEVQRGDIIIYKMSESKGHVAIAISSSMMIDASSNNKKVVKRSFKTSYWKKVFYCAFRIF